MSKRVCTSGLALACLVVGALLLGACGGGGSSSSSESSSSEGGETTAEATTTSEEGGGATVQLATELPVTGQQVKFPEMAQGMEAAMEAINAEGGVNGQQLALNVCDTKFEANGEVGCARTIAGEEPAAVIAPFMVVDASGAGWPIFEKAGLPVIGSQGASLAELNSPNAFLISSGFVGPFAGTVNAVETGGGAKSVAILTDDPNPAGKPIEEIIEGQLKSHGITDINAVIGHTQSDPTFATAVAEVLGSDPEAIILDVNPTNAPAILQGLETNGYEGIITTPSLSLPPQSIEAAGQSAEGMYLTSEYAFISDDKNPGIEKFKEDMKKYQPDAPLNGASLQGWSGMELFAGAAAGAKAMEAKVLLETFESIKKPVESAPSVPGPWSAKPVRSPASNGSSTRRSRSGSSKTAKASPKRASSTRSPRRKSRSQAGDRRAQRVGRRPAAG